MLVFSCLSAFAAGPPDAGQILQGIGQPLQLPAKPATALPEEPVRPAMSADSGLHVVVKGFKISGARVFSEAELQGLLAESMGKELGLAELQALAQRITGLYRERGYLLARAYIPAQDIRDGIVEISVLEGRLGKLNVENKSLVTDASVQRALAGVQEGEALDGTSLERRLLLLNDLPGAEVRSTLKPGASVGTTDLDVQVLSTERVAGRVELDNYGNRFTGDVRLGGALNINSPLGLGDSLSARGFASAGTDYGRLAYQLPVGPLGTKLGVAGSSLYYKLRLDFAPLQSHGTADIGTLYALQPVVRSRSMNVNLQASYDGKHLNDRVDATATVTDKRIGVWVLGASGDRADNLGGGGLWNWSLAYAGGNLRLDPVTQALDAAGLRTQGNYGKTTVQLVRLQRLAERLNLYVQLSGQAASKNLDTSEKMGLGGAFGVRAYPQGEAASDDALMTNVELRYALAEGWQLTGFVDAANGSISHAPLAATNNNRSLSGAGFGVNWSRGADLTVQSFVAWHTGAAPTSDVNRSPRIWVQAVKNF